jgi:hypothetical protein
MVVPLRVKVSDHPLQARMVPIIDRERSAEELGSVDSDGSQPFAKPD